MDREFEAKYKEFLDYFGENYKHFLDKLIREEVQRPLSDYRMADGRHPAGNSHRPGVIQPNPFHKT